MSQAEAFAATQIARRGRPLVNLPAGVLSAIVVIKFEDGTIFAGTCVQDMDDQDTSSLLDAAQELYASEPMSLVVNVHSAERPAVGDA